MFNFLDPTEILKRLFQRKEARSPIDYLPDFDNFDYKIAILPNNSKLTKAWDKLRECERRLSFYRWIESFSNYHSMQYRVLLNDSASGFVLTFETTIQVLEEQSKDTWNNKQKIIEWVINQPDYNTTCQGIYIWRVLDAHIETKSPLKVIKMPVGSASGNPSHKFHPPKFDQEDLESMHRSSRNKTFDINAWEELRKTLTVAELFEDGIKKLRSILNKAEEEIRFNTQKTHNT